MNHPGVQKVYKVFFGHGDIGGLAGGFFGRRGIGVKEVLEGKWLEVFFGDVKVLEVGASASGTGEIDIVIEFEIVIESVRM
ncbi:MAG: hypothetical protein R2828_21810 [Saprospiraceae bacterium]